MTVPAASSATTPADRSHVLGRSLQAPPPSIPAKYWDTGNWPLGSSRNARSNERRKSLALSASPDEYRIPDRTRNVYVRPPSAGRGRAVARSGTSVAPSDQPTRLNPTSPSFVRATIGKTGGTYAVAGSMGRGGENSTGATTRRIPPRWLVAVPRTATQSD